MNDGFTSTTPVPLYWVEYGNRSADPLLILHGGPGASHDYLLPQMLALSDRHRVILYDQRGGGKSVDESRSPVPWQTHVADLERVVAELVLTPVTLVGYSWGGLLAMLFLSQKSAAAGEVVRLVLIDPAPAQRAFRKEMETEFSGRQNTEELRARREALATSGLRESDPDRYKRELFEIGVSGYFHDPVNAKKLTAFRVVGRIQDSVWNSLGEYDLLESLSGVGIPALVLHGRQDPIPLASSRSVARALNAELVVLENCGHVPYVEQPQQLFSAIENFLDAHPAANRSDKE